MGWARRDGARFAREGEKKEEPLSGGEAGRRRRSSAASGVVDRARATAQRSWRSVLSKLTRDANWMERVALLCAMLVLLTGLFYKTAQSGAAELLRAQEVATDVVCVGVVLLSSAYVAGMSLVPLVVALYRQIGQAARRGAR